MDMVIRAIAILVALTATACAGGGAPSGSDARTSASAGTAEMAAGSPTPATSESPQQSQPPNPCDVGDFGDLPVGATCWVEPNALAALEAHTTPVRILYTVPAAGWSAFLGPYNDVVDGEELQRVTVNFADIRNLTVDACADQVPLDPAVGPTVDNLASALATLPPFEVVSPPSDVTAFGYSGKHLEITVPAHLPWQSGGSTPLFTDCDGRVLETWIAPPLSFAYYGYTAPGDIEEFWILDVEGRRIAISALRSANASAEMLAEQQAILESIVIQP